MIQDVVQAVENTVMDVLNSSVHTAMPGVVVAVYPESGMIDAQPVGSYYCSGIEMDYPLIPGIPLCISANSDEVAACFPVREGDAVLLIIAEQSLSAWLTDTSEAQSDERFELTNCIAIPGLVKVPVEAQLEANEEDAYVVRAGESKILVRKDGIEIQSDTLTIKSANVRIEGNLRTTGTVHADGGIEAPE